MAAAEVVGLQDLEGSLYLRDDTELYRVVDTVGSVVWLENCRSLTLERVPVGELRGRGLRRVVPESD